MEIDAEFVAFVRRRGDHHLRTALLLTGDWHAAEDLVQAALVKLYRVWRRLDTTEDPDAYLRRILVNTHRSWWRSRWRRERPVDSLPELPVLADGPDRQAMAAVVRQALLALPSRQRTALVLRYFEDLPEAEVAQLMGCGVGSVKTHVHRGVRAMRRLLPHTGGQSFRVHITEQDRGYDGAFDPARRTGRLASPVGEDRYVGDTVYTRNPGHEKIALPPGKSWISAPRMSADDLGKIGTAIEVIKLGPQDPQFVLQRLRSATRVRETGSASGNGWTGHRYSFAISDRRDAKGRVLTASGTVTVDSHGLVRVLSLHTGEPGQKGGRSDAVIQFGDYGVRVDVAPPPAAQVIAWDRLRTLKPLPGASGKRP